MKYISKIFLGLAFITLFLTACEKKVDSLPSYSTGKASVLSTSVTAVAAPPADSLKPILKFSWTNPGYATTSSKYIIEIDSSGRNFSKSVSRVVLDSLSTTYTAKELNDILLGFGFAFNVAYDIDVRIISSYANNNDQKISNTIKISATPYKVPPKIALPTTSRLFLVGDASQGGWNNPVPVPSQEFARLDETTWAGVFDLNGGKQYLVLPDNGSWSNKFSVANNTIAGLDAGGDFGFNLNDNFPGPANSGTYIITLNFQTGKFTVSPYVGSLPYDLFMVGDATPGGWNNPVPVPSQQFTRLNSSQFELTLAMNGGKEYLLLPQNGSWSNKYAVANKSLAGLNAGGNFGYNLSDNFPGPTASGNYKVEVNFVTNKFKVTQQ